MHRMMIRSVVLSVLVFAGCAVSGESGPVSGSAESSTDQSLTITCEQRCQLNESICESRCARDPFDPQNDCGCGDEYDLCIVRCGL